MRPLKLCQLFRSDYNTRVACAYIFYSSGNKIYDHEDVEFGTFMPNNNQFSYDAYMQRVIVPIITQGLLKTQYQPAYIDHYNQSPQPFLGITRRDNLPLTDHDLKAIQDAVETTLTAHNKKQMPPMLFSKYLNHDVDALQRAGQTAHHYSTRNRK